MSRSAESKRKAHGRSLVGLQTASLPGAWQRGHARSPTRLFRSSCHARPICRRTINRWPSILAGRSDRATTLYAPNYRPALRQRRPVSRCGPSTREELSGRRNSGSMVVASAGSHRFSRMANSSPLIDSFCATRRFGGLMRDEPQSRARRPVTLHEALESAGGRRIL